MISTDLMPFQEALAAHAVKSLLPTTGRTSDLQKLDRDIKQRSIFSATVDAVPPLQKLSDVTSAMLDGKMDQATARLGMKQLLAEMGYQPDPELAGGLQDLSSDARIDLQLSTNVATARGAGWYEQGQQPDVLDEFPARELYDANPGDTKHRRDVEARWVACGGKFYDGRMIALVTDDVWDKLGDPAEFDDGLGNQYAPFWFNSFWRQRDIDRDETESLGLIDADTQLTPEPLDLNADLQASPDVRDSDLRDLMEATGLGKFDGTVFKFDGGNS